MIQFPASPETPPQPRDLDLEQSVLGAVLASADALSAVRPFLQAAHFSEPIHATILDLAYAAHDAGHAAIPLHVVRQIEAEAGPCSLPGMTWGRYVANLIGSWVVPPSATVIQLARELVELSVRRGLIDLCRQIEAHAANRAAPVAEAANTAEAAISALCGELVPAAQSEPLGTACAEVMEALLSPDTGPQPLMTGLTDLDHVLGGVYAGNMVVVGGRTGMGKTAFGVSLARAVAESGGGVGYFSLEMTRAELAQRAMADMVYESHRIAYQDIRRRRVEPEGIAALREVAHRANSLPIHISDLAGQTISQIRGEARRMARTLDRRGTPMRMIVVDHLSLVQDTGRWKDNRVASIGEISGALKALAKELDVAVVALCQLNRGVEGRDDKRPQIHDLRDSGSIEQDADQVLLLYREEHYLRKRLRPSMPPDEEADIRADIARVANLAEIIVAKNRHGSERTVTVYCAIAANAWRNLAGRPEI